MGKPCKAGGESGRAVLDWARHNAIICDMRPRLPPTTTRPACMHNQRIAIRASLSQPLACSVNMLTGFPSRPMLLRRVMAATPVGAGGTRVATESPRTERRVQRDGHLPKSPPLRFAICLDFPRPRFQAGAPATQGGMDPAAGKEMCKFATSMRRLRGPDLVSGPLRRIDDSARKRPPATNAPAISQRERTRRHPRRPP